MFRLILVLCCGLVPGLVDAHPGGAVNGRGFFPGYNRGFAFGQTYFSGAAFAPSYCPTVIQQAPILWQAPLYQQAQLIVQQAPVVVQQAPVYQTAPSYAPSLAPVDYAPSYGLQYAPQFSTYAPSFATGYGYGVGAQFIFRRPYHHHHVPTAPAANLRRVR